MASASRRPRRTRTMGERTPHRRRLPDDHDDVIAMRTAPRTMLISTALYVGGDADIDEDLTASFVT